MPRIDPAQLLNCLQILLSPTGGILSDEEVNRLASLMTKFSKKLVSKCVYVLILKNTDKRLLHLFMGGGGWTLIQLWLHDAMCGSNFVLVKELLELLLLTPVDVERLKSNNIPKLVKSLSKREDLDGVCRLASQLVQQWLKIVKDETQSEQQKLAQANVAASSAAANNVAETDHTETTATTVEKSDSTISTKSFYKSSAKDGKQTTVKINSEEESSEPPDIEAVYFKIPDIEPKEHHKDKSSDDKKKSDKSRHRSSSSLKSKSSHKDRHSSRDKDKSRDKDRHHHSSKDKDRHRSNGSTKSGSSNRSKTSSSSRKDKDSRKETKEKQIEKDKDTLHQIQPQSIQKLPKIPKKSSDDTSNNSKTDIPKGSISIEVRKNVEERPKTVKVYKSKMRSTGLEEEPKPPPPRVSKKVAVPPILPPSNSTTAVPGKRSSPLRDTSVPPEKKSRIDVPVERPGAIKLIPPKPKPAVLQESDMFMDALTAAMAKKEPKKRKRRASNSKDTGGSSPPLSPTSTTTATSPLRIKNISPPKFYQDTLQTEESKPAVNNGTEECKENHPDLELDEEPSRSITPMDYIKEDKVEVKLNSNGLRSVLVLARRRGQKKSIKWKADDELVDIRYFELDDTERVNVTRTFGDMAKMDVRSEREAIQASRKLQNEDVMEAQTVWKVPTEIDLPPALVIPGGKSYERNIQFAREKNVASTSYFNKRIPDNPTEPDPEIYKIKDPIPIPVEDTDNPDHDFRKTPWPEPKGSPPHPAIPNNPPPLFPSTQPNFQNMPVPQPPNFIGIPNIQAMPPPLQFPNPQPAFISQPNIPGDWNPNRNVQPLIPPNIPPSELMNQGPSMNPMYIPTPEHFNPMMNDGNNHRFPGPFLQQGPPQQLLPQNNFNQHHNQGSGRGRGNNPHRFRRGGGGGGAGGPGGGGWMRMNGPPQKNWHSKNNQRNRYRRGGGAANNNYDSGYSGDGKNMYSYHN